MRYRYRLVTARNGEEFEALLNTLGADGWRLDQFDIRSTDTGTFFAAVLTRDGSSR